MSRMDEIKKLMGDAEGDPHITTLEPEVRSVAQYPMAPLLNYDDEDEDKEVQE